jgi:hypothetical protein
MVCIMAGSYAEAKHRKQSVVAIGLTYGRGDFDESDTIAKFIEPDPEGLSQLHGRTEGIVKRFLREPDVWALIQTVAEVLSRDGTIDGEHALLRDIDGWRAFDPNFWPARRGSLS